MDTEHIDIAVSTVPSDTRRRAIRLLAGVPLAGILASLLGEPETAQAAKGKGRNRRRRKRRRDQDRSGPKGTCPPDPRFAAVEACWAKQGAAVRGDCDCAWHLGQPQDFPCLDDGICMHTIEGTGFCGQANYPLPEHGDPACLRSSACPPSSTSDGTVFDQACVTWPTARETYCWPACRPRQPEPR
jgi:hypothetical protein